MGIIYKPKFIPKIINAKKTQTRRPLKADHRLIDGVVYRGKRQTRWLYIGAEWCVHWKYGKPATVWCPADDTFYKPNTKNEQRQFLSTGYQLLKIRVLNFWQEDVRDISHAHAVADGFGHCLGFWQTWCGFYDSSALTKYPVATMYDSQLRTVLRQRPDAKYNGWAIEFEVVR